MARPQPDQNDPKYAGPDGFLLWQQDYQDWLESPGESDNIEEYGSAIRQDAPPKGESGGGDSGVPAERVAPAGAVKPEPIRDPHWWESPDDDRTNDSAATGGDFASAVFEDSETKQFSADAQAGMAAAKAANDEAGYNGIKDAERERLASEAGYSAEKPPPRPGRTQGSSDGEKTTNRTGVTPEQVEGMTLDELLKLIGQGEEYRRDVTGLLDDEGERSWIDEVARGDTEAGTKRIEEARKRAAGG